EARREREHGSGRDADDRDDLSQRRGPRPSELKLGAVRALELPSERFPKLGCRRVWILRLLHASPPLPFSLILRAISSSRRNRSRARRNRPSTARSEIP